MSKLKTKMKLDWLETYGGEKAVEMFGEFIEKASDFATANNIPYKEADLENGENEMELNTEKDLGQPIETPVSIGESLVEPDIEKAAQVETETIVEIAPVETETVVESVVQVVETVPLEKERIVTFAELEETIDTFTNEVFAPLMDIIKDQGDKLAAMQARLDLFEKNATILKEAEQDLEIVPQVSVSALIKERLTKRLDGMVVNTESVAPQSLLKQKPDEYEADSSSFASFLQGI